MTQTVNIQQGLTIYDYASSLLGGFDNIIFLIKDNPSFVNMNVNLSAFATKELVYDDSLIQAKAPSLIVSSPAPQNIIAIKGLSNQSLMDLNLLSYGGFDNYIKFCSDNDVSTNDQDAGLKAFTFDSTVSTDFAMKAVLTSKGYIFASLADNPYGYLLQENDGLILQENDGRIII